MPSAPMESPTKNQGHAALPRSVQLPVGSSPRWVSFGCASAVLDDDFYEYLYNWVLLSPVLVESELQKVKYATIHRS